MTGHLKMTAQELEAVRRVSEIEAERALYDGPRERAISLSGRAAQRGEDRLFGAVAELPGPDSRTIA